MLVLLVMIFSIACSGEGGIDGSGEGPKTKLVGTVATGEALGGVSVTLKDADGKRETVTTGRDGKFTFIDIKGKKAPYILKVDRGTEKPLFSIANTSGNVNVHPFTDLLTRNLYKSKFPNRDLEQDFDAVTPLALQDVNAESQAIFDVINSLLRLAYLKFNIDANFDFLLSSFNAKYVDENDNLVEGSDFDKLLDYIKVNIHDNEITITLIDPVTGIEGTILVRFDLSKNLGAIDSDNPSTPTGLTIIPGAAKSLVLLWNSSVDNVGVVGYRIYKDTPDNLIATTPYPVFVDEFDWALDTSYCYFVQAYDAANNISNKRKACFDQSDAPNIDPPLAASNLSAVTLGSFAVNVSWIPSPDDVIGYDVYRKSGSEIDYTKVSTIMTSAFDDIDLLSATEYCYYVKAVKVIKLQGNSGFDTLRSAPSNISCTNTAPTSLNDDIIAPVTTATPAGGTYNTKQVVELSCVDNDGGSGCAATYYTLDGSTPTTKSSLYTQAIEIGATGLLKYFSLDASGNHELPRVESYILELPITTAFVSNTTWSVEDSLNSTIGFAQFVCLRPTTPANCPAGATNYNFAWTGTSIWDTDLSSIPGAGWIWAPGISGLTPNASLASYSFSKSFDLGPAPVSGTIFVAVDDYAEIYVNNNLVGALGAYSTTVPALANPNTFDLTSVLVPGMNTISISVQNGPDEFAGVTNANYSQNPAGIVFGGTLTKLASNETINSEKAITGFSVNGVAAIIDEVAKTIELSLDSSIDITAIVASYTTTGNIVQVNNIDQVSGETINDFSNPVVYTIIALDGSSVEYTVTVNLMPTWIAGSMPAELTGNWFSDFDNSYQWAINANFTLQTFNRIFTVNSTYSRVNSSAETEYKVIATEGGRWHSFLFKNVSATHMQATFTNCPSSPSGFATESEALQDIPLYNQYCNGNHK